MMYGEAFYGFHTAQHQLQWSKNKSKRVPSRADITFKMRKNKSANITAELNRGSDKMENLIFSILFHETIYCGIQLESPQ